MYKKYNWFMCSKIYLYNSDFKQPPQQALRRNDQNIQVHFFFFFWFFILLFSFYEKYITGLSWTLTSYTPISRLMVIININKTNIDYAKINKNLNYCISAIKRETQNI